MAETAQKIFTTKDSAKSFLRTGVIPKDPALIPETEGKQFKSRAAARTFLKTGQTFVEPEKEGIKEGFIKPTLKAVPRVTGAIGGSLALAPGAGIRAGVELLPKISTDPTTFKEKEFEGLEDVEKLFNINLSRTATGTGKLVAPGSLKKAEEVLTQIMEVPGKLITTEEEAKSLGYIGNAIGKPFEMAGEGWRLIGSEIETQLQDMGLDVNYVEPTLATMGEASAIFAFSHALRSINTRLKGRAALKQRIIDIPERGIVIESLANAVKKNPKMTVKQILQKWDNPRWRAEALKTYVAPKRGAGAAPKVEPFVKPTGTKVDPKIKPTEKPTVSKATTPEAIASDLAKREFAQRFLRGEEATFKPPKVEPIKPVEAKPEIKDAEIIPEVKPAADITKVDEPYSYEGEGYKVTQIKATEKDAQTKWQIEVKEDFKPALEGLAKDVEGGQTGKRIPTEEGDFIGISSTFPEFMLNKGWTGKEVSGALRKAATGETLGIRQADIVESAMDSLIKQEHIAARKGAIKDGAELSEIERIESEVQESFKSEMASEHEKVKGLAKSGDKTAQEIIDDWGSFFEEQRALETKSLEPLKKLEGVRISKRPEHIDSYEGQHDMQIRAFDKEDNPIGWLEYTEFENKPSISMIEVDPKYRRKGIATAMHEKLKAEYPGVEIEKGLVTDEGFKLFEKTTTPAKKPAPQAEVKEKTALEKAVKPKVELKAKPKEIIKPTLKKVPTKKVVKKEPSLSNPPKGKEPSSVTLYSGLPLKALGEFYTENIGAPIWDKGVMKGVPALLEKVPGGRAINRALLREYRGDLPNTQEFIKSLDKMKRFQAIGREYAIDLGNRLQKFPESEQIKMGASITGDKSVKLSPQARAVTEEARQALTDLGRQAVDAGLLSEDVFFKNMGKYMPRLYTSKEYQTLLTKYGMSKPNRLDTSRFKKRKEIPKEIRKEMGEILTPGFPVAKGIMQLTHDIEMARFFNGIVRIKEWAIPLKDIRILPANVEGTKWGVWENDRILKVLDSKKDAKTFQDNHISKTTEPVPVDFKQLPKSPRLGKLSEAYVHPEIFGDLNEAIRLAGLGEKTWNRALGSWKFGKVILSPKTHARNLMSNSILAHLGGLPLYEQPVYLTKAANAMRKKTDHWVNAKKEGLLAHTFAQAELRVLFDQVGQLKGIQSESVPDKLGVIGTAWEKGRKSLAKAADIYEAEEQWFKMAKYIHNVERLKMSPQEAAADAEKWLFNYSKLTKFQDKYRRKWYGAPFATFTFKSIPRVSESIIKYPWRFATVAALLYGLEKAAQDAIGDTDEERKAKKELRPKWQKGSFLGVPNFMRVPFVDEFGREHYLNLSYILPWGDLGEGGDFGPIPGGLMPFSQPFIKEPFQQIANFDTFWKSNIVKPTDVAGLPGSEGKDPEDIFNPTTEAGRKALGIRFKHAATTFAPTPFIDVSKGYSAFKGKPDYRGRLRAPGVVAADVFAGVKLYPVDYAESVSRSINKIHPSTGSLAIKIKGEIKTLNIKKQALEKAGKDFDYLDKQIEGKIHQLEGLAIEAQNLGKEFSKIKK